MENLTQIRRQFPITRNRVFLNHAAESPLPKPVAEAVRRYLVKASRFGGASNEYREMGKHGFAKLVGAKTGEIALIENTSMGLNIAANVLRYPPGSKVITTDLEYPSV